MLCPTVPGDLLGSTESAFLGFYLGLPFLTSNFLLPILFPAPPHSPAPHTTAHAHARRNLHMLPCTYMLTLTLSGHCLDSLYSRGQIFLPIAHGSPFDLRYASGYKMPLSSSNLPPTHLQIKSLWVTSAANTIHIYDLTAGCFVCCWNLITMK